MTREIDVSDLTRAVKILYMDSNTDLNEDMSAGLKRALAMEVSPAGKEALSMILRNAEIAREKKMPLCQDTGFPVVFLEIGQDVHWTGGDFTEAIQEGVRQATREGTLRRSIVKDPIERNNTGDNTPAVIHAEIVPGNRVKVVVAPKGGGSENMSEIKMLPPSAGLEGLKEFVVDRVCRSGANPCPPVVVGVGIGGTFEKCALIAKKALLRPLGSKNPDPVYAELEAELLERINRLGIGPQGFGGRCTALGVHVEVHPCHIASFPVAVNMQCHSARHRETIL